MLMFSTPTCKMCNYMKQTVYEDARRGCRGVFRTASKRESTMRILLFTLLCADDSTRFEAIEAKLKALEPRYALTFPGQYRVNFYSIDNDLKEEDRQSAYRARIRQNVDIRFDEQLSSSVRFQLNHTNASTTDAKDAGGNGVLIRHAFVDFAPNAAHRWRGGFVPVKEYHHDLLYSAGWATIRSPLRVLAL